MTCISMGIILSVSVKKVIKNDTKNEEEISVNPIRIISEDH